MMRSLLVTAALVATSATAFAQPALTPLTQPAEPAQTPAAPLDIDDAPGAKSPAVATALSVAGTLVPAAMIGIAMNMNGNNPSAGGMLLAGMVGIEVLPSLGNMYSGHYITPGLGGRVVGTVLMAVGVVQDFCFDDTGCSSAGEGPMLIGAGLFVAGTVYDIATAGSEAHAWNKKHLQLAPTAIASNGHTTMGVGLGGRF